MNSSIDFSERVADKGHVELFTRHGSNQYASRVKPVPRSKISPHKRPPIHRGPHANGHASEDPVSLVQTVPDHLSHLAHIIPQETLQGPSSEGPFVSEGGHTKIRFPGRRMTMPEMRKRTKAMLDYLARVQVEMAERESRNAARVASNSGSGQTTPGSASEPLTEKKSLSMMDGLSRDIIRFQERCVDIIPFSLEVQHSDFLMQVPEHFIAA